MTYLPKKDNTDAFGRLRVSDPETIFDSKLLFQNTLYFDDAEESGSGTGSSHSIQTAMQTLSVSGTTAGVRTRQTYRRFNYEPGKSLLVLITGVLDLSGGGTGITRRIGLFDDNNGLFFEDSAGTVQFIRRTSTSGSPVDNSSPIAATTPSGDTIDWSKTQIFWIDYEWLGVGKVRAGIVVDGKYELLHEEDGANSGTTVYMSVPNLPIRYQIVNDGTGAASTLGAICSTVMSEGGSQSVGAVRRRSTQGTHVDLAAENTLYGLIGLRLRSGREYATIQVLAAQVFLSTAASAIEWVLVFDPTITGTFTFSNYGASPVQVAVASTAPPTISGGYEFAGGYAATGAGTAPAASSGSTIENALSLGVEIDGTQQTVVLCARPIDGSTNVDVEAALVWRELV